MTLVVEYLGWDDYRFGHSTVSLAGAWQDWLGVARWWNIQINVNPTHPIYATTSQPVVPFTEFNPESSSGTYVRTIMREIRNLTPSSCQTGLNRFLWDFSVGFRKVFARSFVCSFVRSLRSSSSSSSALQLH